MFCLLDDGDYETENGNAAEDAVSNAGADADTDEDADADDLSPPVLPDILAVALLPGGPQGLLLHGEQVAGPAQDLFQTALFIC